MFRYDKISNIHNQRKGAVICVKLLSVIVPCYNEQENVKDFYEELFKNAAFFQEKDIAVELLYIDDGSRDKTADEVRKLHGQDERVHLLSFSRNFGKEAAIYAGLQKAKGDLVVLMDADLQDPPSLLPEMYGYIEEGYDSVATRRVTRKGEPVIRSFFARMFYRLMHRISKTEIVDGARDYRLMTRKVVDAVLAMTEYNRFTKGILGWVGYETKWLEYENVARNKGETKWSFWKLFRYSLEGIVAFSTLPLTVAAVILLRARFCYDHSDHCEDADIWRSHFRLAFSRVHYPACKRRAAVLSRHSGTVSVQDLYGSEEKTYLSCERGFLDV